MKLSHNHHIDTLQCAPGSNRSLHTAGFHKKKKKNLNKIVEDKTVNGVFLDRENLGDAKLERKQLSEIVNEVKINCCWRVLA